MTLIWQVILGVASLVAAILGFGLGKGSGERKGRREGAEDARQEAKLEDYERATQIEEKADEARRTADAEPDPAERLRRSGRLRD